MTEFNAEKLTEWLETKDLDDTMFIVIKTRGCGKCMKFVEDVKKMSFYKEGLFAQYTYNASDTTEKVKDMIESLEVLSVPILVTKVNDKKVVKIDIDGDRMDLENSLEAIVDGHYEFFGHNEYGEAEDGSNSEDVTYASVMRYFHKTEPREKTV